MTNKYFRNNNLVLRPRVFFKPVFSGWCEDRLTPKTFLLATVRRKSVVKKMIISLSVQNLEPVG